MSTTEKINNQDFLSDNDYADLQRYMDGVDRLYQEKLKHHFSPKRYFEFITIIWPSHKNENPNWHRIGRRLMDLQFFLSFIDAPDYIQHQFVWLAQIAFMREYLK